jgi:hypothetical protein
MRANTAPFVGAVPKSFSTVRWRETDIFEPDQISTGSFLTWIHLMLADDCRYKLAFTSRRRILERLSDGVILGIRGPDKQQQHARLRPR